MQNEGRPRPSMMSIPPNWSELYFNLFAILCVANGAFLVWYEITRRGAESDYIDTAMRVALNLGSIGLAAAIQAFIILKVRDGILMTWERYKQERYDRGLERGIKRGLERGREQGLKRGREQTLRDIQQQIESRGSGGVIRLEDVEEIIARLAKNGDKDSGSKDDS